MVVGSVARTCLRETPDFIDAKKRMKKAIEDSSRDGLEKVANLLKSTNIIRKEKVAKRTFWAYLITYCGWPLSFYLAYMYFNQILKVNYGYTAEKIILHNFNLKFQKSK